MKTIISLTFFFLIGFGALITNLTNEKRYAPREAIPSFESAKERSIAKAAEYYYMLRRNQITGEMPYEAMEKARIEAMQMGMLKAGSLNLAWDEMGPDNVGGRTRAILIDWFRDPSGNTLYAGGVAGGLWKSTNGAGHWFKVSDQWDNTAISSICQDINGRIYVGTGEYLLAVRGTPGTGNSSAIGGGIYFSDDGSTFNLLSSTDATVNNANQNNNNTYSNQWSYVYALAASPVSNRIYAGTPSGLRISDDNGSTWINPVKNPNGTAIQTRCADIEVSADGQKVLVSLNGLIWMSDNSGDDNTWVNKSTSGTGLPTGGISNTQLAISPDDKNYIYASVGNSSTYDLKGVYRSTDGGASWTNIGQGGSTLFQPFANQADYNMCIAVKPGNKDEIVMGGLDNYKWQNGGSWQQISAWNYSPFNSNYVHADNHTIVFHKTNGNVFYIGNDGGVYKTTDGGDNFSAMNRNYNVTQFYSVAMSPFGTVIGGTQDNGTNYINFQGNTSQNADEIMGGDGFDSEISGINPNAFFGSLYFGDLRRSPNNGSGMAPFYTGEPTSMVDQSDFHTVIRLWESFDNPNSQDTVYYVAPSSVAPNQSITVTSNTSFYPFTWTNTTGQTFAAGETIPIVDKIQSRIAVALNAGSRLRVFIATKPLDFSTDPYWMAVASNAAPVSASGNDPLAGSVNCMAFSGDGNHLYLGTGNGNVYRISNLNSIQSNTVNDTITGWLGYAGCSLTSTRLANFGNRVVTSVAVDPNDADKLIVTLGNYDNQAYVYRCTDATTAPSASNTTNFSSIQGTTLPKMPIYSSLIDYSNGNRIILGTEYGIWTSNNSGGTWTKDSDGFPNTQVFMLRQQTLPYNKCWNTGHIFAATHGRGIFRTTTLTGLKDKEPGTLSKEGTLRVYPNPAVETANIDFYLPEAGLVTVRVYSVNGKLLKEEQLGMRNGGAQTTKIALDELSSGVHLVQLQGTSFSKTVRMVVKK